LRRRPCGATGAWAVSRNGVAVRPWESHDGRLRTGRHDSPDRLVPASRPSTAIRRRSPLLPTQVWAALTQVTMGELRVFRVLSGRIVGRARAGFDADEPALGWAVRFGFSILGEERRRELVVDAIGQPWRLAGGQDFEAFDQAGYAKMAATFRLALIPAAGSPGSAPRPGSLHRCRLGTSLGPLLVADPPYERRDPSQLAGGDQAPRRTRLGRRSRPRGPGALTVLRRQGVSGAEELERGGCVHRGSGSSVLATPRPQGSQHEPTGHHGPGRHLQIEFRFLDLDTCTRCRATDATLLEAIQSTRPALDAVGVAVSVTRPPVASEARARVLGLSAPTIRIDGVDIAGELVESACDSCSETCVCNGGVDCRDWVWRGQRSAVAVCPWKAPKNATWCSADGNRQR
jgi:hypothetical protein